MIRQISDLARRSRSTLIEDMAGVAALTVLLLGALHLPGLI
ncbi:hypothetical protein [Pseudooceanicola nitratireducens]|jgi:hypothetical protein|uniref:Uncharacterized protein n=1 Tax=Pseudooceanicola nitratireducens TaxID=517719 RepID=A0A1I1M802_9RHOB|nr:hypothetical protein [Pseudooceanicola nitratireducens]MEC7298729.1 hypothetical protein [Pseudomonadota bacterium]MEC7794917.1 hypothetical protein [Pseudomonadota bacterium]MEC8667554.1 hypothetical protein [Pseudomonadota bacterium]SEI92809.1 hypothetical protein SAMN05216183_1011137 [Pseudooceanicola nitratireducens]SFC78713.1 hypothetical protein SAMN05421762_2203 [Pseudooceanicola nitratireducens]